MEMLAKLVNFDTKSLIGAMVWGNIATGVIVYLYQRFNMYKSDYDKIRSMTVIRFLSAIGYLMMFFRGDISDIVSVNICNTLLFICHYLEARLMLKLANVSGKETNTVLSVILGLSVLTFNLVEFFYGSASLRVGTASVVIFAIFLLPTVQLLSSRNTSRFKRGISIFYIFLLCALIPRTIEAFTDTSVNIHSNDYYQTLLFMALILMMFSNTIIYLLFMKEQTDLVIEKMATIDHLTNVMNRYSFLNRGRQAFESHKLSRSGLGMLFFDIDHFKDANDQYGHRFGDEVLIQFAKTIQQNIRPSDLCCRYGGEEFIVLLMNVDENICKAIGNRIMKEIENLSFEAHPEFRFTTSVGSVSGVPKSGEILEDYIHKSDEALYQAKKAGRNRLVNAR